MADTPNPPQQPPKYLPRIKYQAPEPAPEADEEAGEDELDPNLPPGTPRPKPKAKPASVRPASPEGNPAKPAGAPKAKAPDAPVNPPRAKPVDKAPPRNPPRAGAEESLPSSKRSKDAPAEKPRGKSAIPREERGDGAVDATPEGETFEGRRRVRMIVGGVAGAVVFLALFSVYRSLQPDAVDEAIEDAPPQVAAAPPSARRTPEQMEQAAKSLLGDARSLERANKLDDALKRIDRILAEFGDTPSAKLAREAKERHAQGLPLFVRVAAVVATKGEAPTPEVPEAPATPEPETPTPVAEAPVEAPAPIVVEAPPAPPPAAPALGPVRPEPRRVTGVGLPSARVAARALPPGFHARAEAGVHASGWPLEITCDKDGGSMVLIPGDVFIQGRDDGKPEERPAHRVQLSPYYIDQHEVTARQYALFRGGSGDDRPMTGVTLADARAYAEWAGKRLPTEAQWEMAARATDARLHPWGNAPAAWERPRQPKQVDPVMSFPSDLSPYGVYDLSGNAWEWTNDWFEARYYAQIKGQTPLNPTGPSSGKGRLAEVVIKGGSKDWDGSWRSGMRPDARLPYLGFRCVLNLDGTPAAVAPAGAPAPAASPGGAVPF